MAFATKYRIEGTSDVYGKVTINIKKDGYVGSVINLEGVSRDFVTLKIGSPSNDISNTILSGSASIQYYCLTEFQTIELAQSEIFTFLVEINDSLGENIWTGWVMPEDYSESYTNTPYVVNIVASDFLDGLKNVAMGNLLTTKTTLWNALRTALAGTRLELRYLESINIYADGMADTGADSPLTQAEVSIETFEGLTCYDAINIILKPFFARVYQYRGWRIENITEKRDNYVQRLYNIGGVYQTNTNSLSLVQMDNSASNFKAFIQKSGQLNFKPSLNSANSYFPSIQRAAAAGLQGFEKLSDWTSTSQLVSWTNENGIVIQRVATEYNGSEFGVFIDGKNDSITADQYIQSVAIPVNPADNENVNIQFDYKMDYPSVVILGTKPILYVEFFLDATSADYYWTGTQWVTSRKYIRISASPRNAWRNFSANIGVLPEAGNLFIRIHRLVKSGTTGTTKLFLTKFSTNIQVEAEESNIFLFASATSSIEATFKGPSFEFGVADGLILGANGVMEFGSALTDNWTRKSQADNLPITSLFLLQWLSFHQYSGALLQGTLHQKGEHITPVSTIEDDPSISTKRYILNSWEMSLGRGVGTIIYREIPQDDVAVTIATGTRSQIDSNDYLIPGIPAPNAPSPTPVITPQTPVINFETLRFLNGDVTGDISTVEVTPSSIQNKARLDTTGLTADDIVLGAVKDSPDQENMTNLRLSDIKPLVSTPVTIGSPANGLSIDGSQVLTIGLASTSTTGALSSTDWNTFNNKLNLTSPITGYTVGANTALADTDTILQAFGKVQGQINARISGTIASGQVAFGTGVDTIGGDSGLTWDNVNKRLLVGAGTPASLIQASNSTATGIITWDTRTNFAFVRIHADSVNENLLNWGTGTSLRFATSSTTFSSFSEVARLNATGFGIGTSPSNALDILKNVSGSVSINIRNTNTGTSSTSRINLNNDAGNATFAIIQRNSNDAVSPNTASFGTIFSHSLSLFTASTDRLHITSTGLIGINTTTPTNTLDVNGTARIRTINNLGVSATNVLVPDATGVVSLRTASQFLADAGGISGTIASGQVAFGTGVNTVGGNANLTYINAQFLTIGGTTSNNGINLNGSSSFIRQIIYQVDSVTRWIQNVNQNNFSISRYNASGAFIDNALSVRLSTGFVGIGEVTNPTNTLDVNGTARIRTISNLGTAATSVLVPSATGVLSLRTLAEFASDAGLTNFWTLTGSDIFRNSAVAIGRNTIPTNSTFAVQSLTTTNAHNFFQVLANDGTSYYSINQFGQHQLRIGATANTGTFWSLVNSSNATLLSVNGVGQIAISYNNASFSAITGILSLSVGNPSATTLGLTVSNNNTGVDIMRVYKASSSNIIFRVQSTDGAVCRADSDGTGVFALSVRKFSDNSVYFDVRGDGQIRIGQTSTTLGFYGATPIVQPTTAVASGTLVSNAGTTLTSTDTIDGYTLQQVVRALRNTGLLA